RRARTCPPPGRRPWAGPPGAGRPARRPLRPGPDARPRLARAERQRGSPRRRGHLPVGQLRRPADPGRRLGGRRLRRRGVPRPLAELWPPRARRLAPGPRPGSRFVRSCHIALFLPPLAGPAAAKETILTPRLHHLRCAGPREWSDFPERPEAASLS